MLFHPDVGAHDMIKQNRKQTSIFKPVLIYTYCNKKGKFMYKYTISLQLHTLYVTVIYVQHSFGEVIIV